MSEQPFDRWEAQLEETARGLKYPPTPDIASAVSRQLVAKRRHPGLAHRRVVWALATVGVLIIGILLVPPVRAGILEVLRIGAVRIFLVEPTSTPLPPPSIATPTQPTVTPQPTATPLTSVLDLAGETTLAEARRRVNFPIRLPTYPADLGPPDKVFVQEFAGPILIFVWLDDNQPSRVRLSLYQLPPGPYVEKSRPRALESTSVNGRSAIWAEGAHLLITPSGSDVMRRLVDGHLLVWTEGDITYRLETDLSQAEAIRIAESFR
jgi:hypothetical protein